MSFPIYENGTFKNRDRLNDVGKLIYGFLEYCKDQEDHYWNSVTGVYVYSMQREGSESHSINKAIDIGFTPLYMNLWFFRLIHEYMPVNIFLSAHNKHLHIDVDFRTRPMYGTINPAPVYRFNLKKVEYKVSAGVFHPLSPNVSMFTEVPVAYRGNRDNKSLVSQYELPYPYEWTTPGAIGLLKPGYGLIGAMLWSSRYYFNQEVPVNQKRQLRISMPWWRRVYLSIFPDTRPSGGGGREGEGRTITPTGQSEVPWNLILLTVGGLGVLSILSDNSSGGGAKIKRIEFE